MRAEVWGLHESASAEQVVRALGANAASMAYNIFMDASKRVGEGQSVGQIAKNAKQQVSLGAKDSGKAFSGALFDTFAAISPSQEAAGQAVMEKVKGIKQVVQALNATTKMGTPSPGVIGTKQRGFQELQGGSSAVAPPDPQILQLSQQAKMFYTLLDRQFLGKNKDLYEQRQSVQISTRYSPEMKRGLMNGISNEIIANDRAALQYIQLTEQQMSKQFGRKIQFDKIDLNKGIDQFSLNP
jgi:hypothetical protein